MTWNEVANDRSDRRLPAPSSLKLKRRPTLPTKRKFAPEHSNHRLPGSAHPTRLTQIEVGQRLDDFDLLIELGSGAFARVFLARQLSLQRLVAVKISANHGNEPQTLAQLDHDYIVRVFDQRILRDRDWRLLYMQYLPGGTLLDLVQAIHRAERPPDSGQALLDAVDKALESRGEIRPTESSTRAELATLSWPETVAWLGKRLAEALHYATSRGVLHRDIKLANVLLAPDGTPKLADFNISFARNVSGASPFDYFGGSLSYMSPEQLMACRPGHTQDAANLDTRSDIYSLAVVLWELLTGRKPFDDSEAHAARGGLGRSDRRHHRARADADHPRTRGFVGGS